MNDLLTDSSEIQWGQSSKAGDIETRNNDLMNSVELGLEEFIKKVQDIEKQYEKLGELLKKLQDAHQQSKAVTKAPAMKAIKRRMEKDADEVGKIARLIKTKMKKLDKENLANRHKPGCEKGSAVDRSRMATTVDFKQKFKAEMGKFQDSFVIPRGQPSKAGDIEMGNNDLMNSVELDLEDFFKKLQDIEKQHEKLGELLIKLQDAHEQSKAVTNVPAMKDIKQRMEKDVDEVGKIAHLIKTKIDKLDKENLANRHKLGCGKGSAVDRSRMATTVAFKQKFKAKMGEFQCLREKIHQEYREFVKRHVSIVTGVKADEETIDRLVETGDGEQIFQKAIQEQGRGQIVDTLAEVQERHDSVRDLEKKLLDLQQIFMDMAVFVDAQGDMLDNIEFQVSSAVDYVASGNTALQKAKSLKKKSRKWMCAAITMLLIIIAVASLLLGLLL